MEEAHGAHDELTAPAEEPGSAAELDKLALTVLARLRDAEFFPGSGPLFVPERFRELDELVRRGFTVPHTTMTALARRVLFGLSVAARPATIVVCGTFVGYAAVWLFGPALLPDPLFQPVRMVGCDVFAPAVEQARQNFSIFDTAAAVEFAVQDATELLAQIPGKIDLLFLDVDAAETGKKMYAELLRKAVPKLGPGALILAHDVTHPYYRDDVSGYRELVRDRSVFRRTATLEIDPCGLEVTVV